MGTLFIVATPIGNLQDMTKRAIDVLATVDAIACEDTRKTGSLLKMLGIEKKQHFISYYEQNEYERMPQIITALQNGLSVALVSDSGTPTISDPGFKLVRTCIEQGIKVIAIPGPSSVITALVVSGLPTDKFLFLGFLPKKEGHRKKLLENTKETSKLIKSTILFFEAPHRLIGTLEEMQEVLGDVTVVLARELTKVYEEIQRGKISELLNIYKKRNPKGEYVILYNLQQTR